MNIIRSERRLCLSCMEVHDVKVVEQDEITTYKGLPVTYRAIYSYCENTDELFTENNGMDENYLKMVNAFKLLKAKPILA